MCFILRFDFADLKERKLIEKMFSDRGQQNALACGDVLRKEHKKKGSDQIS